MVKIASVSCQLTKIEILEHCVVGESVRDAFGSSVFDVVVVYRER